MRGKLIIFVFGKIIKIELNHCTNMIRKKKKYFKLPLIITQNVYTLFIIGIGRYTYRYKYVYYIPRAVE